jgi:hypothetical protein
MNKPHNKLTTEMFIERSRSVHNNKYDYSNVNYSDNKQRITIICPQHGEFVQIANNHINGMGCPKCGKEIAAKKRIISRSTWIERFRKAHGKKYDYSKSEIINSKTNIKIICKEHGVFEATPENHGKKNKPTGCPRCKKNAPDTLETFINKAKKIHGNKYDYSKSIYKNTYADIVIICPRHGDFSQKPNAHIIGSGCPQCGIEARSQKRRISFENFIEKCIEVHGKKYDYSKTDYRGRSKEITLICKEHGEFNITADSHLSGSGCQKCAGNTKLTQNEFINRSIEIHGTNYDYSKSKYVGMGAKVEIICSSHGSFWQMPSKHIHSKQGCPKCADETRIIGDTIKNLKSKNKNPMGIFYILRCFSEDESFFKIGVSKKGVSYRYGGPSLMPYEYEDVVQQEMSLVEAYELEQAVLSTLSEYKYEPILYFGGHSECLSINPRDYDDRLNEILTNYDQ